MLPRVKKRVLYDEGTVVIKSPVAGADGNCSSLKTLCLLLLLAGDQYLMALWLCHGDGHPFCLQW